MRRTPPRPKTRPDEPSCLSAKPRHRSWQSRAAHRGAVLFSAMLSLQTGCTIFPSLPMGSESLIRQLPPQEAAQVERWAQNAWADCVARSPHLAASSSYEEGFREGYINRLTATTKRRWQAGYRHGERLAVAARLRGMPRTLPLEPTPLKCSRSVLGDVSQPSAPYVEDLDEPSAASPDAEPFAASPSRLPTTTESIDLQPQPEYTLHGEQGIIEAPTTSEIEAPPRPPQQRETLPPKAAQPPGTSPPRGRATPPRSSVPNALDLELTPDAESAPPQSSPSQQDRPPAEDQLPLEDELDLLSPFGNAVPPVDLNRTAPGRNGTDSGPARRIWIHDRKPPTMSTALTCKSMTHSMLMIAPITGPHVTMKLESGCSKIARQPARRAIPFTRGRSATAGCAARATPRTTMETQPSRGRNRRTLHSSPRRLPARPGPAVRVVHSRRPYR